MPNFDELTTELKKIITNTQKSAKQAWQAGETLRDIRTNKNFKPKYKNFNDYTKKEFNITDNTAEQYIKIYEKIPLEMITDNMLVTHLSTLAEMPDELKYKVLKTMRWAEEENKIQGKNKVPYDADMVLVLKQIVESIKENSLLSQDIFNKIFKYILNQDIKDSEHRTRHKKDPLKEAIPIDKLRIHKSFKKVSSIYSYAPISEQGLVGLFCTIFHILKKKTINYEGKQYNFSKILYIRVEFPDAKIELTRKSIGQQLSLFPSVDDIDSLSSVDNIDIKLDIEFELESFNYWRHKHHEATEKCDMIICWEIDKICQGINMPPILSIKELLETGEVTLHYSNNQQLVFLI